MPSDLAALRGEPSYVWRAGQERRLQMIAQWGELAAKGEQARVLIDGCGVGMYASQIGRRYTPHVEAFDIEYDRVVDTRADTPSAVVAVAEAVPYPNDTFDLILSHEVLEHVNDDRAAALEMVRVLRPGGRIVIFAPNRWYPFETHGHYWQGEYHFGNTPLINYLPDGLRNRLAPHVRAYTAAGLRNLFLGQPVRVVHHTQIYPGYDNIIARRPALGHWIRRITYTLEQTLLTALGLSHLLVVEKSRA